LKQVSLIHFKHFLTLNIQNFTKLTQILDSWQVVLLLASLAVSHSATLPLSFAFNPFVAVASPANHFVPLQSFAPAFTATQYHAQDEFGQASFGYAHPGQAATNFRDAFGNQVGSYAYINPEGKEIRVSYVADSNGFRVLSNALPEGPAPLNVALPAPVQDTPEVAAAKAAHLAAVASARSGVLPAAPVNTLSAPSPVEDTPEVRQAKAEFFAAFNSAAIAAAAAPEK
jgi:Insect cuticle protein